MPVLLVHGVPDTHHLWDGLRAHLTRRDVPAPDLPGFGATHATRPGADEGGGRARVLLARAGLSGGPTALRA